MARNAAYAHATQVNASSYPDDGTSPVGTTEWNEDPDQAGMIGITPTNATITIASGVATPTDSICVVAAESSTTDTLQKLALANTNQYDFIYLFADTGDTITLEHGDLNADGEISTISGANETLSTTQPTILIRKGNYWYGYGGGAVTTPTDITIADESSDTTCFPLFVTAATGDLAPKSGSNLAFNSSSGILTATGFAGALTGNVTGDASGTAGIATNVTVADESSDTSCNVLFTTAATGNLPPKSGTNLTFNSNTGALTATSFAGALTGNVTGNADTVTTNANLTGEVTSSGNTATIADDIIQEGNLQVSNAPTNGHVLTARSGVTGGYTWEAAAGGFVATADANLNMTGAYSIHDIQTLFLEHQSSGFDDSSNDRTDESQLFVKQEDTNNDGLYVRLRVNGATQNVKIA